MRVISNNPNGVIIVAFIIFFFFWVQEYESMLWPNQILTIFSYRQEYIPCPGYALRSNGFFIKRTIISTGTPKNFLMVCIFLTASYIQIHLLRLRVFPEIIFVFDGSTGPFVIIWCFIGCITGGNLIIFSIHKKTKIFQKVWLNYCLCGISNNKRPEKNASQANCATYNFCPIFSHCLLHTTTTNDFGELFFSSVVGGRTEMSAPVSIGYLYFDCLSWFKGGLYVGHVHPSP